MKIKITILTFVFVLAFGLCAFAEAPEEGAAEPAAEAVETTQEPTADYGALDDLISSLVSEDGVFRAIDYSDDLTEFFVYVDPQQYDPALDNSSLSWLYPLTLSVQANDPESLSEEIIVNILDVDTGESIDSLIYGPADEWICANCGFDASGNYCSNCGASKEGVTSINLSGMDLGSMMEYILPMISQSGDSSGGTSGLQTTKVNDINTYINFYIYQPK